MHVNLQYELYSFFVLLMEYILIYFRAVYFISLQWAPNVLMQFKIRMRVQVQNLCGDFIDQITFS